MGNTGGGGTAGPDDLGVLFHLNDSDLYKGTVLLAFLC